MNEQQNTALVFPAFVTEFVGCETDELRALGVNISDYLGSAVPVCGDTIASFDLRGKSFLQDELLIQYITYIYSCAVSDLLRKKNLHGGVVAGYSMGIYAALYHARCISFTDGLILIREAYRNIRKFMPSGDFTMGLTGGLELDDVRELMKVNARFTHIINSNNKHTFVYSGPTTEVNRLINAARNEGALMTRVMNVSIPYHSPYLEKAAGKFAESITRINLRTPDVPVYSPLSLNFLEQPDQLARELAINLWKPFRWHDTIQFLLDRGVNTIIECGAGEGLSKINKFIPGDYKTITLKNLRKFLENTR